MIIALQGRRRRSQTRLVSLGITTIAGTGLFSRFLRRAGQDNPRCRIRLKNPPLNKHSAELVILPDVFYSRATVFPLTSTSGIIAVVFCSNCFPLHASLGIIITHKQSEGRGSICHGIEKISVSPQGYLSYSRH